MENPICTENNFKFFVKFKSITDFSKRNKNKTLTIPLYVSYDKKKDTESY